MPGRRLCALLTVASAVVFASVAAGTVVASAVLPPSAATWNGSQTSPLWSNPDNWTPNVVPVAGQPLIFPVLPSQCSVSSPNSTCYISTDDLSGASELSVPSVNIDAGASYQISGTGNGINATHLILGSGGLTDAPSSNGSDSINDISLPITLGADQVWALSGSVGTNLDIAIPGGITGPGFSLGVTLAGGPNLNLQGTDSEVGPVTITGKNAAHTGLDAGQNGTVNITQDGSLDGTDEDPVVLTDAALTGVGSTGPLDAAGADIDPSINSVGDTLVVDGATSFDADTVLQFSAVSAGAVAGTDFTQLGTGSVTLGNADLALTFGTASGCYVPALGNTYKVIAANGAITGELDYAGSPIADGSTIPLTEAGGCPAAPSTLSLRINYTATGVTATVVTPTTLTGSATSPVAFGQLSTYSATVTPEFSNVPTGTVNFNLGSSTLCTATLIGGSGSCTAVTAPIGHDAITAVYSGDNSNLASTVNVSQNVTTPPGTALSVVSPSVSPNPVTYGQTVTYSVAVTAKSGPAVPTGTVTFSIGGTPICTTLSLVSGDGSCTSAAAPVGASQTVTATYSGDGTFAASAGTTTLTVNAVAPGSRPSTTTPSVTPSPVPDGGTVTYSVIVSPTTGAGAPTGSVVFKIGATTMCTATPLVSGAGSCTSAAALVGPNQTVTATYSGDITFAPSSGVTALSVTPVLPPPTPTTTKPTVTPNPVTFGQLATYSATVKPTTGPGTPTGSVTFSINGTPLCTTPSLVSGAGSCQSPAAPLGPDTVTATYSGNGTFAASAGVTSLTVNSPAGSTPTTTTPTVTPNPVTFGQLATYSATVAPTAGPGTPTGTVTFSINGTPLCTTPSLVSGAAFCFSPAAPLGPSQTVTATYSGSGTFAASAGVTSLTVNSPAGSTPTTTTPSVLPNPVDIGSFATYSVMVRPTTGNGTPTGSVSFSIGATFLCIASPLSGGAASCQSSAAPLGGDTVTATYSGDGTFGSSVGTTPVTVTSIATTTTPSVSPNPAAVGATVTYSADVAAPSGSPTGVVTFSIGGTTICTTSALFAGSGSCQSAAAAVGTDAVTASYVPSDGTYGASTGTTSLTVTSASSPPPPPPPAATRDDRGYWLAASDGGVFSFGDAQFYGSLGALKLNKPVVGIAATPDQKGYWMVASDGGIFSFGDAQFYGSTGSIVLNKPIVGMAPTPDGKGYWLVASDGGIFSFGDAQFYGSTGSLKLNKPVVGMASTPDGKGYWLVATDGGIFSFGDAQFEGSTGSLVLNKPVVGMASTPDGKGYWMVATDGGIFSFGDAPFFGSTGSLVLNKPVVGMGTTTDGNGYWMVATDGGIFSFGDAPFFGSTGSLVLNKPIVGMAVS
jgi:hypothetical protein